MAARVVHVAADHTTHHDLDCALCVFVRHCRNAILNVIAERNRAVSRVVYALPSSVAVLQDFFH